MVLTLLISRSGEEDRRDREREDALAKASASAGLEVLIAPPIYHVPEGSGLWDELRRATGRRACAAWLYPRATEALLRHHGVWREGDVGVQLRARGWIRGLRRDIFRAARWVPDRRSPRGSVRELDFPAGKRWYPVLDPGRCKRCGNCFQFCLFGVYARDESGEVRVENPDRCKPGCPACGRICPEGAILFPLHVREPAIAGAPGLIPKPDARSRRMYYLRTGSPCPACGSTEKLDGWGAGPPCPECGRRGSGGGGSPGRPEPADELDALIDGLDRIHRRKLP